MPRDLRLCAPDELPPGRARVLEEGARRVAVFNVGGALHAIDDLCSHRWGPLSEGDLEGFLVSCPWHGWQFDVRSGACDTVADRDVASYPVRLDGDAIVVTLPDDPEAAPAPEA